MIVDQPVNLTKLASLMGVSLKTISRHIHVEGYRPCFGRLTTLAHYQRWLSEILEPQVYARRLAKSRAKALSMEGFN